MKKILLSTLALLGVMGLVACSNQEGTSSSEKSVKETRQSSTFSGQESDQLERILRVSFCLVYR